MFLVNMLMVVGILLGIYYVIKKYVESNQTFEYETAPQMSTVIPIVNILKPKLTESYLTLENYIGQTNSIEYLQLAIKSAKKKNKPLKHTLLWGGGGLGKSTLMKAIAHEMGGRFFELVPANLRSAKELFGILFDKICPSCQHNNPFSATKCLYCKTDIKIFFTPECKLEEFDILFIEECHGLKEEIEEALYSLMQDGYLMLRFNGVDQRVDFPQITIGGATTQLGHLNKPFRDRFKLKLELEPYTENEMKIIVKMYAEHTELQINEVALVLVANISHGTPRIAKNRVDDAATISSVITTSSIKRIMKLLNLDENGLDRNHHKGMRHIIERMKIAKNGGAGSASIASSVGIPRAVWEDMYEPGLLYQDLIFMGSRGRRLTSKALDMYFAAEKSEVK